ncbi:MAG: nucleic acid-binding protein [Spirochaetales bacterium]|nr:nucleic acid-binding protein [Spirochaetales bacterium]
MMQEVFDKLRSLQEILSQRYEIEREINEVPRALTTKTELLNRLRKQYIEKNSNMEETRGSIIRLRHRLAEAEQQRETYEKQMDLIKTQREYEALDKEIRDATEKEQQLRKEILREEKEQDEIAHTIEREESMIQQQEEELEVEQKKIKDESEEKKKALEALRNEEGKITPDLDGEILFKFERIIKSKAGIGIVPVKSAVCTGCHMRLPAQFENDVRKGEEILFCPYCSRILFFEDAEEEGMFFQDDDAGSLADLADFDVGVDVDEEGESDESLEQDDE